MFITVYYGESLSLAMIFFKTYKSSVFERNLPTRERSINEDPKKYNLKITKISS